MNKNFIAIGLVTLFQFSSSWAVLPNAEAPPPKPVAKPQKAMPATTKSRNAVERADGYWGRGDCQKPGRIVAAGDVLQITQPNGTSIIEKVTSKNENAFETVVTSPKEYEGLEYKYSWLSEDRLMIESKGDDAEKAMFVPCKK